MSHTRTLTALLLSVLTASCAGTGPLAVPQWLPEAELRNQAATAKGPEGLLYLRREIQGRVEVRQNPAKARSQLTFRHVVTRRGDGDAGGPLTLRLLLPKDTQSPVYLSRVLHPKSGFRALTQEPVTLVPVASSAPIDPSQRSYEVSFDDLRTGEILEVITTSLVRGSLVSDAQWLAAADAPTQELIVRYDLPPTARGALVVHGHEARPMVAQRREGEVLALRIQDLPARGDNPGHYRYTTRSAEPRGYKQRYSRSWADVSRRATRALVETSEEVRGGYAVPYRTRSHGAEAVGDIFRWVRDRIQREDAQDAHWSDHRPLGPAMLDNDLTATDKVHLLCWILDEAGVASTYGVARDGELPSLERGFPAPDVFDAALLYLPDQDLWLDPACQACAPGQVRPALRGGQALRLDHPNEGPLPLPAP